MSKTFDNGMICASEQAIVALASVYDDIKAEFIKRGCAFLNEADKQKLKKLIFIDGKLNAAIVGQTAHKIAQMAGIDVPVSTKILIVESDTIDISNPFAHEKLSPILGFFKADTFEQAVQDAHL